MELLEHYQALVFEALELLGPEIAAISSGFAIMIGGVVFITPAGERYLERLSTCP